MDAQQARLVEEQRIHVTTVDDVTVVFATEDGHSKGWFYPRYAGGIIHEPPLSRIVVDSVRPGDVFLDVGSHIGYFACLAAARGARVFAFEMQTGLVPMIERNAAANGFHNIYVLGCAVSDRVGLVSFQKAGLNPGKKGLAKPPENDGDTMVNTVTLDSLFLDDPKPDFIKIDVEGAELQVLAGARRILERHHPTLFLELHCRLLHIFETPQGAIYDLLHEAGYGMRTIQHRDQDAPLSEPLDRDAFLALTGNPALVCD